MTKTIVNPIKLSLAVILLTPALQTSLYAQSEPVNGGSGYVTSDVPATFDVTEPENVIQTSATIECASGCANENCTTDGCSGCNVETDEDGEVIERLSFFQLHAEPYKAYRRKVAGISWMPGDGNQFGWVSMVTTPYLSRDEDSGFTGAANIHWLSGPQFAPLPPRVYDLVAGYQWRDSVTDQFSFDLFISAGVHSDFEDSARDGRRFPAHAVGILHMNPHCDFVFGADYLDRDDLKVLPVVGLSLRSVGAVDVRLDLVFPRPRIDFVWNDSQRMYLAASTGGGNWDIEYPDESNGVINYHDYRISLGFEAADENNEISVLEFNYVFDRHLNFRNRSDSTKLEDAFMIQFTTRY